MILIRNLSELYRFCLVRNLYFDLAIILIHLKTDHSLLNYEFKCIFQYQLSKKLYQYNILNLDLIEEYFPVDNKFKVLALRLLNIDKIHNH